MTEILLFTFIYMAFAVAAVLVSQKLGLGSVLGYLAAGILIGPVLGLVGKEAQSIQHVAEFGVVMMLFLVGLELAPQMLWRLRHKLLGLGGLQVGLTLAAIAGLAMLLGKLGRQVWPSAVSWHCRPRPLCCRHLVRRICCRLRADRPVLPYCCFRMLQLFLCWRYYPCWVRLSSNRIIVMCKPIFWLTSRAG